jgi:hypothetical protein
MLEERPIKMNMVYGFFGKLDERPTSKESSNSLNVRRPDKSPTPKSPHETIEINKSKLLDDLKKVLNMVRNNNAKIFKG